MSTLQLQMTITIHIRRRLQPLKYDIANYNIAIAIMAQRMQQMSLDQQPLSIKERFHRIFLPLIFFHLLVCSRTKFQSQRRRRRLYVYDDTWPFMPSIGLFRHTWRLERTDWLLSYHVTCRII